MKRHNPVVSGVVLLTVLFFVLPPLALIIRAVQNPLTENLNNSGIFQAIVLSLFTTTVSAVVVILLGTPLAYALSRFKIPFRRGVVLFVQLPIVLPPAVAGLALLLTFGRRGVIGQYLAEIGLQIPFSVWAVIIAQIFVGAPFYIRAAQNGFSTIPMEIRDAARVDGADGFSLFFNIDVPLAWRSLTIGLTLSWTRALGEFGATILFAGSLAGRTQTMPLLVYNALERDLDVAIWMGLILIGIAVGILGFLQWLFDGRSDQNDDL